VQPREREKERWRARSICRLATGVQRSSKNARFIHYSSFRLLPLSSSPSLLPMCIIIRFSLCFLFRVPGHSLSLSLSLSFSLAPFDHCGRHRVQATRSISDLLQHALHLSSELLLSTIEIESVRGGHGHLLRSSRSRSGRIRSACPTRSLLSTQLFRP
jgi:hypothetical protein